MLNVEWHVFALHCSTEPNVEGIDRKAGEAIKEFKDVVFPDDYDPSKKLTATKRKVTTIITIIK